MILGPHLVQLEVGETPLQLKPDSIVCVVGPNSSGKSSLLENMLRLMAGGTGRRHWQEPSQLSEKSATFSFRYSAEYL